jgi:hypothetical protein
MRPWGTFLSATLLLAFPVSAARMRAPIQTLSSADTNKSDLSLEIDLGTLKVSRRADKNSIIRRTLAPEEKVKLVQGTIPGSSKELVCLGCNTTLFRAWLLEANALTVTNGTSKGTAEGQGARHPNSPGYDKWKRSKQSLLMRHNTTGATAVEITEKSLTGDDVEKLMPWLQGLWAERQLVLGDASLGKHLAFEDFLTYIAQESPVLTPKDCESMKVQPKSQCGHLYTGPRPTASASELRAKLDATFGASFLEKHAYDAVEDQGDKGVRASIQALLSKLKASYSFYYSGCLAHGKNFAQCDMKAASQILGRITCTPEMNVASNDCVYAELRRCEKCTTPGLQFFEFYRPHGAVALFDTKNTREGVMGRCSEFSRAAHGLFASLGYETRLIVDFTDHVWVEIRVPKGPSGKWIHADPSEGVMDQPLMYEQGWGKKLTMIFALTPYHIEHVTAKYTANYEETVKRRGIDDASLNAAVEEVNVRLQSEIPRDSWGHPNASSYEEHTTRLLDEVALWSRMEASI